MAEDEWTDYENVSVRDEVEELALPQGAPAHRAKVTFLIRSRDFGEFQLTTEAPTNDPRWGARACAYERLFEFAKDLLHTADKSAIRQPLDVYFPRRR